MAVAETLTQRTARLKALRLARDGATPPIKQRLVLLNLDTELTGGKYAGKTVSDVLSDDPGYIHYIAREWKDVELAPEVLEQLSVEEDPRRGPRAWE